LSEGVKERHRFWSLYVKNRVQLDLALRWATTDPQSPGVTAEDYAAESRDILGPDILQIVNQTRLKGLPARPGTNATDIAFGPGTGTMDALIQSLPSLVNQITKHTSTEYDVVAKHDGAAFADYDAKIAALRRMNDAVKRYLDIDVTVKPAV
jgi:hypothetical protein